MKESAKHPIRFLWFAAVFCVGLSSLPKLNADVGITPPDYVVVIRNGNDGNIKGSGFVWPHIGSVVTAYHVVAATDRMQVSFDDGTTFVPVTIDRVLRNRDLALLKVKDAPPKHPPELRADNVTPTMAIRAWGRGIGLNQIISFDGNIRTHPVFTTLTKLLTHEAIQPVIRAGYPDPDSQVIFCDHFFVRPGASGAPVLDDNLKVCGVVCGGLENGLGSINWIVPADALHDLLAAHPATAPDIDNIKSDKAATALSFSADFNSSVEPERKLGSFRILKLRTRMFSEIAQSNFDPLGLSQAAKIFESTANPMSPPNWSQDRFDIYEIEPTRSPRGNDGAIVVLPEGTQIEASDNGVGLQADDSAAQLSWSLVRQKLAPQPPGAWVGALEAARFESRLVQNTAGWLPVPGWADFSAQVALDGKMVQRRNFQQIVSQPIWNGFGYMPMSVVTGVATVTHSGDLKYLTSIGVVCKNWAQAIRSSPQQEMERYCLWSLAVMASGVGNTGGALRSQPSGK